MVRNPDFSLALWILISCLVLGAVVNASLLISVGRQWVIAARSGTNGPGSVIIRGTVRRILLRLTMQCALIWLFSARFVFGMQPSTTRMAWCVLVLVVALTVDAGGDMFDYRVLRWQLRKPAADEER